MKAFYSNDNPKLDPSSHLELSEVMHSCGQKEFYKNKQKNLPCKKMFSPVLQRENKKCNLKNIFFSIGKSFFSEAFKTFFYLFDKQTKKNLQPRKMILAKSFFQFGKLFSTRFKDRKNNK